MMIITFTGLSDHYWDFQVKYKQHKLLLLLVTAYLYY